MKIKDAKTQIGSKYGRLTILSIFGVNGKAYCSAKCDCGKENTFSWSNVKYGHTNSCGCILRKHNKYGTPIYKRWIAMHSRCSPNSFHKDRYFDRGIKVCERWKDFNNFFQDMGDPPASKKTLDRINNDGDYEPSNCRWADMTTQNRNRGEYNKIIEYGGEKKCISELANDFGISRLLLRQRLKSGMSIENALSTEKKLIPYVPVYIYNEDGIVCGGFDSITKAGEFFNIPTNKMHYYLKKTIYNPIGSMFFASLINYDQNCKEEKFIVT